MYIVLNYLPSWEGLLRHRLQSVETCSCARLTPQTARSHVKSTTSYVYVVVRMLGYAVGYSQPCLYADQTSCTRRAGCVQLRSGWASGQCVWDSVIAALVTSQRHILLLAGHSNLEMLLFDKNRSRGLYWPSTSEVLGGSHLMPIKNRKNPSIEWSTSQCPSSTTTCYRLLQDGFALE